MKKGLKWAGIIVIGAVILGNLGDDEEQVAPEKKVEVEQEAVKSEAKPVKAKAAAKPVKKTYGIKDQVKVGKLTYVANDVKMVDTLSNVLGEKKTSGQFLVIGLTILNGDKEERFVDSNMFKVNVGDTEYSADTELDLYANEDGMGFFLETINPNIEKTGNIVFELPKQVKNPKLEVSSGFGWAGGQSKEIQLTR
ncbi:MULTISPECIES: DUF4352 domain-containing protein [unclassified Exiguobacterium]|jgi:hypothetical protein|uniref:DUF4352 domain-containing protein n=1 Tax=unclassified Exiguobacterium TaxID=2644629 RepID=UPI00044AE4DE|nr:MULTISPECIES: DUF4352 domain-containing protein [unclassified Exiguobacterium]EZP59260.1 Telomeric repeat-binding factor 2 [Exiguobacterium sp. RIT341]KQS37733.1 hypothetical protein ASG02_12205 [Exiguobacterium sp. Leaf196]HAZ40198.1 DUF4352 domain-containing protein [Exiguobacterium sp.]